MCLSFDQSPVSGCEGPERDEGGTDEIVFPDRPPVTGVEGIVGIVAKGEIAAPEGEVRPPAALGEKVITILQMNRVTPACG